VVWIASIAFAAVVVVATVSGRWTYWWGDRDIPPQELPPTPLPGIFTVQAATSTPFSKEIAQPVSLTKTPDDSSQVGRITPILPATLLPAPRTAPVIGGADKVAFFNDGEIWVVNLDGSDLVQLTRDGEKKSHLQWRLDGNAVYYLSGECIQSVELGSPAVQTTLCLAERHVLGAFQFAPDEKRLAVVVDQGLYLIEVPSPPLHLIMTENDLKAAAPCPAIAPYQQAGRKVAVKSARWSQDGDRLAIIRPGVDDGKLVDLVHLLDISQCETSVRRLDEFPGKRFNMAGYDLTPVLQNIAWDGDQLFALVSYRRNEGFGDLWIYNTGLHRSDLINPVDTVCCYRDPVFSPDGRYLLFAFQDKGLAPGGKILLYHVPLATIGTGLDYPAIPLPDAFFPDLHAQPEPALRTAR
jgi:hypothetical protein